MKTITQFTTACLTCLGCVVHADNGSTIIELDDNKQSSYHMTLVKQEGNRWTYQVNEVQGRSLSHWALGIESCLNHIQAITPALGSDSGTDGSTGFIGLKWDLEDGFTQGEFSFELDNQYATTTVKVLAKAGNTFSTNYIIAPDCDQPLVNEPLIDQGQNQVCTFIYGVHDEKLNDSQLLIFEPTDSGLYQVAPLGTMQAGLDIEALDISYDGQQFYAASGDDAADPNDAGVLYQVAPESGALTRIGNICFEVQGETVCHTEVSSLSIHPNGQLWGWSEECGLIQVNTDNPTASELVFPYPDTATCLSVNPRKYTSYVEDMTWDNEGTILYVAEKNQIWGYQAGEIVRGPYEIGQNVEAIEMLPSDNNKLLLNTHNAGQLKMLDLISGELTLKSDKIKAYRDIEALAACGPV